MNLSAFHVADGYIVQIVVTGFTLLHRLQDNLIGDRRPVQACPLVSLLPTRFLFTFLATWNEFMAPLIYLADQRLYPSPLAFMLFRCRSPILEPPRAWGW